MPSVVVEGARVFLGDCRDVLKTLPDNSVDSVVTDPPYELGFMGKSWDNSGIAYDVTVWEECLRVLKPGGHILAFGGTRTWHRLAVAIEDAGFEIRDNIAWIYGSGFPKSLDVSKAIDKGQGVNRDRQFQFTAWMKTTGLTARQIDDITDTKMGHHYTTHPTQPAIATADLFDKLRPYLPEVPEYIDRLVAERTGIEWTAYKQREVIGQTTGVKSPGFAGDRYSVNGGEAVDVPTTLPSTPEAQKWQGWGTALKPAFEPVVVGRKPIEGTVANNVLLWGVGGLNIDGSRIGYESEKDKEKALAGDAFKRVDTTDKGWSRPWMDDPKKIAKLNADAKERAQAGRWPANVVLDEFTAGLVDEQSGVSVSKSGGKTFRTGDGLDFGMGENPRTGHDDTGGASRFFYQAKASKRDRNEGLEELEGRQVFGDDGDTYQGLSNSKNPSKNFHPTVKPTQLMRYLIKLVTPEGGTVLDPFTGSGSTGKAALLDGYQFIGAELTEEYLPIIEGRLRWAVKNRDEETLF